MAKKSTPSLSDFPAYIAAQKKLDEFQAKLGTIEQAIEAREDRARVRGAAGILAEAEALLAGGPAPDRDHAELLHNRQVFRDAVKGQAVKVQAEVRDASRQICAKLAGEHKAIASRINDAFNALAAAFTEERLFVENLEAQGISIVPPIHRLHAPFDLEHAGYEWCDLLKVAGYNV